MHPTAWRLGRPFGVELRVDHSWVIVAVLVAWSMFFRLAQLRPGIRYSVLVIYAVASSVLLFASILVHEFTHALSAKGFGITVRSITLFIFGGATHADVEAKGPRAELVVSMLGPVSSLILAVVFWTGGGLARFAGLELAGISLAYLGWVNLMLGAFNLLPGFPLDGGRVLRAIVWSVSGDLDRATKVAAVSGEIVGYVLVGAGALTAFGTNVIGGLWIALIGWFLASSARAYDEERRLRSMLRGVRVDEVMEPAIHTLSASSTIRDAVESVIAHTSQEVYPVMADAKLSGFLTLEALRESPREFWTDQRVGDISESLERAVVVTPDADMASVLRQLELTDSGVALVVDGDGRPMGTLTSQNVSRWAKRRSLLAS